jgi:acyl-CoA hydrolase
LLDPDWLAVAAVGISLIAHFLNLNVLRWLQIPRTWGWLLGLMVVEGSLAGLWARRRAPVRVALPRGAERVAAADVVDKETGEILVEANQSLTRESIELLLEKGVSEVECLAHCGTGPVVQVNEEMPRILGDSFLHVSRVDAIVEITERLPELHPRPITDVERKIGAHIRTLIEDGCTIQMGIGGIPDAVYETLDDVKDLGIHTEMISDGAMRAIERGIVTGARKSLHPGKVIITFALGTRELYEFLDNNPFIEAHPVEYVNDPFVISQNENMIAINSAIEVDLTGQICSDSIGARIYSGFGGQVDFIRGAARAKGGRPIIALPSTAKKGTQSRIVPMLKAGAGVVTTRADVHYVITEYGIAHLFGKNLRERAEALISIAHPDFREELERAAKERGLLP